MTLYTSIVRCDCGNVKTVPNSRLRERIRSCGCYVYRFGKIRKHGGCLDYRISRLYTIRANMLQRCYNQNNTHYKDYGGRGIAVCSEWRKSFAAFRDWALANGYRDNLSIDRIDNNGGYSPSNCRWITMDEQKRNRRGCIMITAFEKTMTLAEWSREVGVPSSTIKNRLGRGMTPEKALLKLVG